MEQDNRNAYSEVIEILKFLDDEKKLEVLPIEMLEVLKSKANPEYKPQISKDIPLEEQNLQPETLPILAWIATKYWGEEIEKEDKEEENNDKIDIKDDLEKTDNLLENREETDNLLENREETDNLLENKEAVENAQQENDNQNTNLPVLHKDLKWYEKIKEKILELFDKIFNRKKGNTK